jgi:hypothetical protein
LFNVLRPGDFRDKRKDSKLSLSMSTLPRAEPFAMSIIIGFTNCQNLLKKATGKPSGLGAMSTFILANTASTSSPEKAIMRQLFSPSDTCPYACQKEGECEIG